MSIAPAKQKKKKRDVKIDAPPKREDAIAQLISDLEGIEDPGMVKMERDLEAAYHRVFDAPGRANV